MSRVVNERTWDAARRCLNLFFILNISSAPLSTTRIITDAQIGYGGSNPESEKTKFKRDRELLRTLGIHIRPVSAEGKPENEESTWELDRARTYMGNLETLSTTMLERLVRELITVASNPIWASNKAFANLQDALRGELARRDDAQFLHETARLTPAPPSKDLEQLWDLYASKTTAAIRYQNASGELHTHTIQTYGFFVLDGKTYFVAHSHEAGQIRTFLVDRLKSVEQTKGSYRVPPDFSIRDYLYLPFDFAAQAQTPVRAVFSFPARVSEERILLLSHERGTLDRAADGTWSWNVEVKDIDAAAVFALGHASLGMRPVSPEPLVRTWRHLIGKAVETNG